MFIVLLNLRGKEKKYVYFRDTLRGWCVRNEGHSKAYRKLEETEDMEGVM